MVIDPGIDELETYESIRTVNFEQKAMPYQELSIHEPPVSHIGQVMKTNKLRLRMLLSFSDAQYEKAFIAHYVEFYHRYAQVSLLLGVVLVFGDFLVDYFAHPGVRANFFRVWICVPILFAGLGYSFLQQAKRNWQSTMSAFIVAVALILFWILLLIDQEGGPGLKTWVGILNFTFLTLYCFVILGVQFRFALFAGIVILVAFESAMWFGFAMEKVQVAYWTYHVVTVFILAAAIGWWREYLLRLEYLARKSLDEARQSAEHMTKTKSDFLANMSHEIRTPLNGILGMAEVCLETTLDKDQKHFVGVITKEATSLLEIINEILDLSKLEAGKMEIEQVPFDLKAFFNDLIESFSFQAAQKGLKLISSVSPETPTRIVGDPGRLRQILRNLIGNAIKFTHAGRIVVEAEPAEEQGDRIKLRFLVKDTGIGIPKEKQTLVFESFTQADGSTTRKYGGTGLGLTISKRLAELMGGEIGVDSEEGKGSTFWFTAVFSKTSVTDLHRRREGELRRTIESLLAPSLRGANNSGFDVMTRYASAGEDRKEIRILLAEDYPTNQTIAKRHLEHAGYQVDLAENGELALEAFRCRHYDLILMDVEMPVMDGCQVTKAIRELETEQAALEKPQAPEAIHRVPIIAMTAHAFREQKELCFEAGMDDFLSKPLTKKELISMVAKRLIISLSRSTISSDEAILNPASMTGQKVSPEVVRSGKPIDLERAIAEFEGDKELLAEVIAGFTEKVTEQIGTIREALSCGDAETVRNEAHTIKGGAANLTAENLAKSAFELESKGKSRELDGAGEILDNLEREFEVLRDYIQENFPPNHMPTEQEMD